MVKYIILGILLAVLVFGIIPCLLMGYILYHVILVRDKKTKWARECSAPEDPEAVAMHEAGLKWAASHADVKKEVSIVSEGFKLAGEYFDFGHKKAVIVIPGRTESLLFSYFYGPAYEKDCNVLVIDNRCHGESEGKYNALGFKEYKDILNWGKMLHDELGNEVVLTHCICVGGCASLYALVDPACPDYMAGMVAEGLFARFFETFKTHMEELDKPTFPLLYMVMFWIRVITGGHPVTDGPIFRIDKLKKPILFLHSKADTFSYPERIQAVYDKCTSDKKIVWFEGSKHSRIRINHTEKYDAEIALFIAKF